MFDLNNNNGGKYNRLLVIYSISKSFLALYFFTLYLNTNVCIKRIPTQLILIIGIINNKSLLKWGKYQNC